MVVLDYVVSGAFLAFIALGLYTYASQKPWFQTSVEPVIQKFFVLIHPVTSKLVAIVPLPPPHSLFGLYPNRFAFITDPIANLWEQYVAPLLYVEQSEPVKIDPERFARMRNGMGGMGAMS